MKKKLLSMCLGLLFCGSAMAQMQILYGGASLTTTTLTDGTTLVQFPEDVVFNTTDFQNKISVTVDGDSVANDAIVPNPATTFITENEIETFVYGGKAYSFRFTAGEYFTVVMFSDPHVDTEDIKNSVATKTAAMANLGKEGGRVITFSTLPGYTAKADLVMCLGDMDEDKPVNTSYDGSTGYFEAATAVFHENSIPFITLAGNHDIHCDYFNDGSKGMTSGSPTSNVLYTSEGGGQYWTEMALNLVKTTYNNAAADGSFTVETINSTTGADNEPGHFTFKYKGVRFYCANNYWWQKPWDDYGTTYYSAKSTLDALSTYVDNHSTDASIWVSHFPFRAAGWNAEDASERWWLDQNYQGENGAESQSILPSGDSEYYTSASFTTEEGKAVANKKKAYLADIVVKSKNPAHFSGHAHINHILDVTATNGTKFTDRSVQPITSTGESNGYAGNAFVVLCKGGVGVVEVKRVTF